MDKTLDIGISKTGLLSMKIFIWIPFFLFFSSASFSQSYFEDGLPAEWHIKRREAFRQLMPKNSVAVIFNNPVKNRSNDVDFIYHPNTDFFYLTGFREPNSVLLIFSEEQVLGNLVANELIYVQPRDVQAEMWNGKRLGVEGVKAKLGFNHAFTFDRFGLDPLLDLNKFDKILSFNLGMPIEGSSSNEPLIAMVD
jgi:Xaa-Pro aminopeptidase